MEVPNKGQSIKISKKLPNVSKRWLRSGWQQDRSQPSCPTIGKPQRTKRRIYGEYNLGHGDTYCWIITRYRAGYITIDASSSSLDGLPNQFATYFKTCNSLLLRLSDLLPWMRVTGQPGFNLRYFICFRIWNINCSKDNYRPNFNRIFWYI